MHKKIGSDIYTQDMCIKIYDPNTKKVIGAFSSFNKASLKLGISAKSLLYRADNKKRIYSEYYKKDIAVRWGILKDGDDELIKKTQLNTI